MHNSETGGAARISDQNLKMQMQNEGGSTEAAAAPKVVENPEVDGHEQKPSSRTSKGPLGEDHGQAHDQEAASNNKSDSYD